MEWSSKPPKNSRRPGRDLSCLLVEPEPEWNGGPNRNRPVVHDRGSKHPLVCRIDCRLGEHIRIGLEQDDLLDFTLFVHPALYLDRPLEPCTACKLRILGLNDLDRDGEFLDRHKI